MRVRRPFAPLTLALLVACAAVACTELLGIPQPSFQTDGGGDATRSEVGPGDDAESDGSGDAQGVADAPVDALGEASAIDSCADGQCNRCDGDVCPCGPGESSCMGACVDEQSNEGNCGACGHSCAGGTCFKGTCLPMVLASSYNDLVLPKYLQLYGGSLYGTDNGYAAGGSVWTITDPTGAVSLGDGFAWLGKYQPNLYGKLEDIAISQSPTTTDPAFYVTISGTGAKNDDEGVWWVPLDGKKPFTSLFGFYYGQRLAANVVSGVTMMFISGGREGGFNMLKATDSNPAAGGKTFCNSYYEGDNYPIPVQMAADANNNLYWMYDGKAAENPDAAPAYQLYMATPSQIATWTAVGSCDEASGGFTTLAANAGGAGFGFDDTYVYYSDAANDIWRVPIGGGPSTNLTANATMPPLPTDTSAPVRLVVDSTRIYWVDGSANIWAVAKDGSTTGKLEPLYANGSQLVSLAVDSAFLYFTDANLTTISRLVKD
jgi:hypothetical protein